MTKRKLLFSVAILALLVSGCKVKNKSSTESQAGSSNPPAVSESSGTNDSSEGTSQGTSEGGSEGTSASESTPAVYEYAFKLENTPYELEAMTPDHGYSLQYHVDHVSVRKNQLIEFQHNGVKLTVHKDNEDAQNKVNAYESDQGEFKIHNDCADANVYLKLDANEEWAFWITGYVKGEGDSEPEETYALESFKLAYGTPDGNDWVEVVGINHPTDEQGVQEQRKYSVVLTQGKGFKLHSGDTWLGYSHLQDDAKASFDNGGNQGEDGNIMPKEAGAYDVYLKLKAGENGTTYYQIWAGKAQEGGEGNTSENSEAANVVYKVQFGTAEAITLKEVELDADDRTATVQHKYSAEQTFAVTKGAAIKFFAGEEVIQPGDENEQGKAHNGNNTFGSWPNYVVHNDASEAQVYLKKYASGYSFWLLGYDANEANPEVPQTSENTSEAGQSVLANFQLKHGTSGADWTAVDGVDATVAAEVAKGDYQEQRKYEVNLAANEAFKLTDGTKWLGYDHLEEGARSAFNSGDGDDGDIIAKAAGTYHVYLKFKGNDTYSIWAAKQEEQGSGNTSENPVALNPIYFTNNKGWAAVKCHYFGGTTASTWPGDAMTKVGTNEFSQDIYMIDLPAGTTGVVFNNGGDEQTVDITLSELTGENNAYYISGDAKNAQGKWEVGQWKYTPAA